MLSFADAFVAAAIELYGRLWMQLDQVVQALRDGSCPAKCADDRIVLFRLELVVLLDACDSKAWQALLALEHRSQLRASVQDLLAFLAVPPEELGLEVIYRAQNFLFDAVLVGLDKIACAQLAIAGTLHRKVD